MDYHTIHVIEVAAHGLFDALKGIHEVNEKTFGKEVAQIINSSAIGSTVAGLASGWVPGVGGTIASGICIGFVWRMYLQINKKVGLSLEDTIVRTIASGMITNLIGVIVGSLILQGLFSLFPGIGTVSAVIVMAGVCYAITLASGILYIKILTKIFIRQKQKNISAQDLKEKYANIDKEEIKNLLKNLLKEGKNVAKELFKDKKE